MSSSPDIGGPNLSVYSASRIRRDGAPPLSLQVLTELCENDLQRQRCVPSLFRLVVDFMDIGCGLKNKLWWKKLEEYPAIQDQVKDLNLPLLRLGSENLTRRQMYTELADRLLESEDDFHDSSSASGSSYSYASSSGGSESDFDDCD
jgi:hypothetical protein